MNSVIEFIHNNIPISLKEYKIIYFWEFLHRFLGRMIGLLFMLPFTYFCYKGYLTFKDKLKYLFLLSYSSSPSLVLASFRNSSKSLNNRLSSSGLRNVGREESYLSSRFET
mgnify:CR=1 FL=1